MKGLLTCVYALIYRITKSKPLAFVFAILYVGILNTVVLFGLVLLLRDVFSPLGSLLFLFRFPFVIITCPALIAANYFLMPGWDDITKEAKKIHKFSPVYVYTAVALLVFMYSRYGDKIF